MARCCLVKLSLAVCVVLAVAWTLTGQPPPDTRDNFNGKASKLPRLSPEELDKKLEADLYQFRGTGVYASRGVGTG